MPAVDSERGLTALATRRPVGVTMVVLTVVVFGWISLDRLPLNLMPDISYPSVTVRTEYAGAAPIDVELLVSRPLEEVLSQVRNLRRISSVSRAEASDVILEFAWETDMSQATTEVREKAAQALLPEAAERPTFLRYDPTLDPILQLGFHRAGARETSGEEEQIALRILAEEEIERDLEGIPGVAGVRVRGGLEKELRIDVDEKRLRGANMTMALIDQRLREENLNQSSGILYEGDQARLVRTVNEFKGLEEIRDIVLRREGTVPVRLRDVARVSFGYRDPEVITRIDGKPCVKIDIFKEADANLVEVARRVRERVFGTAGEQKAFAAWQERQRAEGKPVDQKPAESEKQPGGGTAVGSPQKSGPPTGGREETAAAESSEKASRETGTAAAESSEKASKKEGAKKGSGEDVFRRFFMGQGRPDFIAARLAEGYRIEVMSDQSVFVHAALDDVRRTVISGGLLAVCVLWLFLRNVWFTVAVGLSIPVSVMATFVVMNQCDVSLNLMSLGGLALGVGMLVDNSVVVLESIFRCRQEGDAPRRAAVRGTASVAAAVAASTFTTVAVFFPIVFVEGIAGQVFREQALTVVISLLASLAAALYFIPAMVCRRLAPSREGEPAGLVTRRLLRRRSFFWAWGEFRSRLRSDRWRSALAPLLALRLLGWDLSLLLAGTLFELVGRIVLLLALLGVALGRLIERWLGPLRARLAGGALGLFDRAFERLRQGYAVVLRRALLRPAPVLATAGLLAVGAFVLFTRLESELIPEVHQGEFTVEVRLPRSTRIEETDRVIHPWEEKILRSGDFREIASLTTTVGFEKDELSAGDEGEHTARLLVRLAPSRDPRATEDRVVQRLRDLLRDSQFESVEIEHPVLFSFKTPIEVEVHGHDLAKLREIVEEVRRRMEGIPEIEDVRTNLARGNPEVKVRLDRDLLSRYGIDMRDVGDVLRRKIQGEIASYYTDGDRKVPIRVRLDEEDRDSLGKLRDLVLDPTSPTGPRLRDVLLRPREEPDSDASRLSIGEGPAEIRRIDQQRAAVVTANLSGLSLGGATRQVEAALRDVSYPAEFAVGFGGQKEEMDRAAGSLRNALLLAIFLVYVVMAIQFESLLQPLVIIFSIPLALVGVIPVLWAGGISLSIIVFIGMIVLAGIVVNNAIVLIDTANRQKEEGVSTREALLRAGELRLRPILMTTLTTVLGLLPLTGIFSGLGFLESLLGTGQGAEIRAPLAIVVMSGLLVSTMLTLVVIPVLASVVPGRLGLPGGRRAEEKESRP